MTPARFGFQTLVVLSLVALVSWPEQRQVRAGDFWQPLDSTRGRLDVGGTLGTGRGEGKYLIGYGSASEMRLGAQAAAALRRKLYETDADGRRRSAPAALLALGGKVNGIFGYAQGPRNTPIAAAQLLLRNVSTGKVEAPATADEYGRFAFLDMMPGGYIVELVDSKGALIGASEFITVALNDLRQATVRASGKAMLASFGAGLRPAAQQTMEAASSQGVNRVAAPARCASPPCNNLNP
jgi:hypothetical protein